METQILLNEILNIENLENVKIRLNLKVGDNSNPIDFFKNNNKAGLLQAQYWNYEKKKII